MTFDQIMDAMLDDIASRVIKKISENNSTWLNNIQYKVKAENIEGFVKVKQIEDFEDAVKEAAEDMVKEVEDMVKEVATNAAEDLIKNANFNVDVSF